MGKNYWYENSNLVQRNGCTFQAYGIGFEADVFLKQTNFNSELIIFAGKLELPDELESKVSKAPAEVREVFETTYLLLRISESRIIPLQFEEATFFLKQYQDEILRLSKFPLIENLSLQFITEKGSLSVNDIPDELGKLVNNCGIAGVTFGEI